MIQLLSLPFFEEIESLNEFLGSNNELTNVSYFLLLANILFISFLFITIAKFLIISFINKKEHNKAIILNKYKNKLLLLSVLSSYGNKIYYTELYNIEKFNKLNINDTIEVETIINRFTKSIKKLKVK